MPKGKSSPSKPKLPKIPPRPRPVQDAAVNAVRQANWEFEMDKYKEEMKEHTEAMHERELAQKRQKREAPSALARVLGEPCTTVAALPTSSLASPRRSPRLSTVVVASSSSDCGVVLDSLTQSTAAKLAVPEVTAPVASIPTAASLALPASVPGSSRDLDRARLGSSTAPGVALTDAALSVEPRLVERQRDHPDSFGRRIISVSDAYRRGEMDCLCSTVPDTPPEQGCRCGRITAARLASQVRPSNPKSYHLPTPP